MEQYYKPAFSFAMVKVDPNKSPPSHSASDDCHSRDSDIHKAILANNLQRVKTLLSDGAKLCTGKGFNCFMLASMSTPMERGSGRISAKSWNLVKELLEIEPSGVSARCGDGTTLLMINSTDKVKIQHLLKKGANINDVDDRGCSALIRSYCHLVPNIEAFDELLSHLEDEEVIRKLVVSMIENYSSVFNLQTAAKLMYRVLSSKDINYSKFEVHPLTLAIEQLQEHDTYCHLIKRMLSFKDKMFENCSMLIHKKVTNENDSAEWKAIKFKLEIPDVVILNPAGYFLYCLNMARMTKEFMEFNKHFMQIFEELLFLSLQESTTVVNPINALIFNVIKKCWNFDKEIPQEPFDYPPRSSPLWFRVFLFFTKIQEVSQEEDVMLMSNRDIQLLLQLLSYMPVLFNGNLVNVILSLMPYSPIHPYVQIYKFKEAIVSLPQHEERYKDFIEHFLGFFWIKYHSQFSDPDKLLAVTGVPGGKEFFAFFKELMLKETLPIQKEFPLKSKICSLKELSRWATRAAIFQHIMDKEILLPSYIEELYLQNHLPKVLSEYLLIE